MSSVSYYKRAGSPFFYLRYYLSEVLEPDPRKRRISKTTKIRVSRIGERQVKELIKKINAEFIRKEQSALYGISLHSDYSLGDGLKLFLLNKPDLAKKTIEAYELSVHHFVLACSEKKISNYYDSDYVRFIKYLKEHDFSDSSAAIFTRHLSALWNYFLKEKITNKNIIIKVKSSKTNPLPIPSDDMQYLLDYYKKKNLNQYYAVYLLLLTGVRPSSAVLLKWNDVNFDEKYIKVQNVKSKRFFYFPLHSELEDLLKEIGTRKVGNILIYSRSDSLKFFSKDCEDLLEKEKISARYTTYQLRNTFSSWLANKGVNIGTLKTLLNHSDDRVTDKHYTTFQLEYLRHEIEKVRFKV